MKKLILAGMIPVLLLAATAPMAATPAAVARQEWKVSGFTWVKLVPREAGSPPNDHPAAFATANLAVQLGAVQFGSAGGDVPLFAQKELAVILEPLRQAFAAAGPDQDVQLLSTYRREGSVLNPATAATVRLFHQGGALQMIVHDARKDFLGEYYATEKKPAFTFGSRTSPGEVQVHCPGAASQRPDWLRFPDAPTAASVPPALVAPAAPVPAAAPAPSAPALAVTAARPVGHPGWDPADFERQEQRLNGLKRLREENLITEEEYQEKRKKVLDEL
jgi:hypothetical protein